MTEPIEVPGKKSGLELIALVSMINSAIATGGDVVTELIRSAQSNPLIGMFLTLLLVDVAEKQGLLQPDSALIIKTIIGVEGGVTVATQVIDAVSSFVPSIGTKAVPVSLIVPTATTIVNTADRVDPASAAELGKNK